MTISSALTIRYVELHGYDADVLTPFSDYVDTLVVMPSIDRSTAERSAHQLAARAGTTGLLLVIHDCDRQGYVALANLVYRSTRSRFFAYVAQDAFAGRQWLNLGLNALLKTNKGLLGFNDGKWRGAIASFGLVDRAWASKNYLGNLFNPCYRRHYADVELTVLAMNAGQYSYDANSVLIEVDWGKEQATVDDTDRKMYLQRAANGFGGRITNKKLLTWFA